MNVANHPLSQLQEQSLGDYRIRVKIEPRHCEPRPAHWKDFAIFLGNKEDWITLQPLLKGVYSEGSLWEQSWISFSKCGHKVSLSDGTVLDLIRTGLMAQLFEKLAEVVPSRSQVGLWQEFFENFSQSDRLRVERWGEEGWTFLPKEEKHPLQLLQHQQVEDYKLWILWRPMKRSGVRSFMIFLETPEHKLSYHPVVQGIYSVGRSDGREKPFMDINYLNQVDFLSSGKGRPDLNLANTEVERKLFRLLGDDRIIPPGGHLLVSYEEKCHRTTFQALMSRIPEVLTDLGYLLFQSGCGSSFKNWYIAEGGWEGPLKLQGNKPLDKEDAVKKAEEMATELFSFLNSSLAKDPKLEAVYMERVREILGLLLFKDENSRTNIESIIL